MKFGSVGSNLVKKNRLPFGKIGLTLLAGTAIFFGTQSWSFTGASLDLDFVNNRAAGVSSIDSALSLTRASAGTAQNADGSWTQFSSGQLRRTDKGLLIEEARTNSIRNNSMQGAVAGTPGTAPTNWSVSSGSGINSQIVGKGTENGIDYVDVRWFGTTTGNVYFGVLFEANSQIAASANSIWTHSAFFRLISGTLGANAIMVMTNFDSGGGALNQFATSSIAESGATLQRFYHSTLSSTFASASTAFVRPSIQFNVTSSGVAVDFTLRIGWPQLEQGAFVTSPIRTTSAAVTRAMDAITVNGPTNYVSLAQDSVFVEWQEGIGAGAPANRCVWSMRNDSNNYARLFVASNGTVTSAYVVGGGISASLVSSNPSIAGGIYKTAFRFKNNYFAARNSAALGSPANDNSGAILASGPTNIHVGSFEGSTQIINGYIRRLTLFPSPLTDAQLDALVA